MFIPYIEAGPIIISSLVNASRQNFGRFLLFQSICQFSSAIGALGTRRDEGSRSTMVGKRVRRAPVRLTDHDEWQRTMQCPQLAKSKKSGKRRIETVLELKKSGIKREGPKAQKQRKLTFSDCKRLHSNDPGILPSD